MKMRARMEFHKFSRNIETKQLEIPKLWKNAPQGTSIFQTPSESKESISNIDKLEEKYRKMVEKWKMKKDPRARKTWNNHPKHSKNDDINEPKPK